MGVTRYFPVYRHVQHVLEISEDPGCRLLCLPERGGTNKPVVDTRGNFVRHSDGKVDLMHLEIMRGARDMPIKGLQTGLH